MGKNAPRGQEMCDHYMAAINPVALECMQEIGHECVLLGIPYLPISPHISPRRRSNTSASCSASRSARATARRLSLSLALSLSPPPPPSLSLSLSPSLPLSPSPSLCRPTQYAFAPPSNDV